MTRRTTAILYAVIVALLFATHSVFARMTFSALDPLAFAGLRGLGAGLILVIVHAKSIRATLSYSLIIKSFIIAIFGFGLNQLLLIEGLIRAGTADAVLINGSIPFVTALVARILNLEHLGRIRLLGVLLGLVGLSGFTLAVHRNSLRFDFVGDLLLFGNVLAVSLALVLMRLFTRTVPSGVVAALILLFGGVLLLSMAAPQVPKTLVAAFSSAEMALLTWFDTLVCTALAWLLYVKVIASLGATQAATFSYLQAPLIALITWIALRESPPLHDVHFRLATHMGTAVLAGGRTTSRSWTR